MMDTFRIILAYILLPLVINLVSGLILLSLLSPYTAVILIIIIAIVTIVLLILESKLRIKLRHFERLRKKSFPVDDDMNLYKGFSPTPADIGSDRDVIRELHHQLFPQILETKNSLTNSYLSIIAPPQEGKSTLLLRFAKELVDNKEIVLWADAYKFAQKNPFDELKLIRKRRKKRIFAIIDNIARLSRYSDLLQDLARQPNVKATLIGASRINDWEKVKFENPPGIEYLFENPNSRPRLPYKLKTTDSDIEAVVKKLREKWILKEPKAPMSKPENFYILIWALAAPEGEEDFSAKVLEEADGLPLLEKKAYCYICALHRFGLTMPAPLIRRILGKDAIGWLKSPVKREVISYNPQTDFYRSRHEVVADSIFRYYSSHIAELQPIKLYKNILQKATLREEVPIVLLFQTYLDKDLIESLKSDLREKYEKTFSKSRSAENLGQGWGPIFHGLSCYDLADGAYKSSLKIINKFPEVHNNYACLLADLKKYQDSEKHFKRAIELNEDSPEAHRNFAYLLVKLNRYKEAERRYKRALELWEYDPEAHYNLALLLYMLYKKESYEEAEVHYKRALEFKENFPEAHNNYAVLLVEQGRYQDAEKHYKRAMELKEEHPEAHNNYANLLVEIKKYEDAELRYQRALQLKEDYPVAMVGLGSLYLRKDFWHPKKAIFWLKKAWEYRERLPDKGESVKKALEALSSEKGDKKEEKPPENEL